VKVPGKLLVLVLGSAPWLHADLVDPVTTITYVNIDGRLVDRIITNSRPGAFDCSNCNIWPDPVGVNWIGPTPEAYVVRSEYGATSFGVPVYDDFAETVDYFLFHQHFTLEGILIEMHLFADIDFSLRCTLGILDCQTLESGHTYKVRDLYWSDGSVDRIQYQYIATPEPGSALLLGAALLLAVTRCPVPRCRTKSRGLRTD
jgi:hypothetical protein